MFGKRMALAQLTILFIVVVMVVLVQLYYSAFNSKAYHQQPDIGGSMPPSPGVTLLPPSAQPSMLQEPTSRPMSPTTYANSNLNDVPSDAPYPHVYESPEPHTESPSRPTSSKSMDDMLLKHSPILRLAPESSQEYTPPCSQVFPVTPPESSYGEHPPSSFFKDCMDA